MTTTRSRVRHRLLAAASAGALAIGALAIIAGPAQAAPTPVPVTSTGSGSAYTQNATFTWGISGYAQKGIFGPWRFLNATGNASILNGATQTEYTAAPVPATSMPAPGGSVPANPNAVKLTGGTGVVDTVSGAGKLSWTGSYTTNAYPSNLGAPDETYTDPVLTIAADGSGALTAEFGLGAGVDINSNPVPAQNFGRLTIADFAAGSLSNKTTQGFRATPKYQGVEVSVPADATPQERSCTTAGGATGWWGAWPQAFLTTITGSPVGKSIAPHFYSTGCGGLQDNKPQLPIDVRFNAEAAPQVTVSNVRVDATGATTVTVDGTGFHAPLAVATRAPVGAGNAGAGSYVAFGKFAENWRPSAGAASTTRKQATNANGGLKWAIPAPYYNTPGLTPAAGGVLMSPQGTFSTQLTINKAALDAAADPTGLGTNARYGIYTYGGAGAIAPAYETFTPLQFSELNFDKASYTGKVGSTVPVAVSISMPNQTAQATGEVTLSYTPQGGASTQAGAATLVDGAATLQLPADAALGTGTLTVTYAGDAHFGNVSRSTTYEITKNDPNIALDKTSYAGPAGAEVPVAITVNGAEGKAKPTGTVTLTATPQGGSALVLAPANLVDGKATVNLPDTLEIGTGAISVAYSGDSLYSPTSTVSTFEIGKNAVALDLDKQTYVGNAGAQIPVTATVHGVEGQPDPTGTIALKYTVSGGTEQTVAPAVPLVDGVATVNLPATLDPSATGLLSVGYSGDANYAATGTGAPFTINKNPSTTDIAATFTGTAGSTIPVAVAVSTPAGQPKATGSVALTYTPIGGSASAPITADLVDGARTLNLPNTLAVGSGSVTITYAGDSKTNSSSDTATYTVTQAASSLTLSKPSYPGVTGTAVPIEITVAGPAGEPTGSVALTYTPTGGTASAAITANLVAGKATISLPGTLGAGTGAISVSYAGNDTYTSSTGTATYTLAKKPSAIAVAGPATVAYRSAATYTVTVSSGGTGSVRVTGAGVTFLRPITAATGKAAFVLPATLAAGARTMKFEYLGDGNVAAATPVSKAIVIAKGTTTLTGSVTAPWTAKKSGKLTVKVASVKGGPAPSGKVTVVLKKGASTKTLKAKSLANGTVVFALPKSSKGRWTLKATYAGSTQHTAATKTYTVAVRAR